MISNVNEIHNQRNEKQQVGEEAAANEFIEVSLSQNQVSYCITQNKILKYNLIKPSDKPSQTEFNMPETHKIEAAQSLHKGLANVTVAAVRSDTGVYFGYFDLDTGFLLNKTMEYRQRKQVTNNQITFIDNDITTACYLVENSLFSWQLNEIDYILQHQTKDGTPYAITSGSFRNQVCIFVGFKGKMQVLSVGSTMQEICQLSTKAIPSSITYYSALQQVSICNNKKKIQLFELQPSSGSKKHCKVVQL